MAENKKSSLQKALIEVKEIEKSIGWADDHIDNTSNEDSLTLKYSAVIPMLVKSIQELSAEVEELKKET